MTIPNTYPVTIRESRYHGTYSGGAWVITAGLYEPAQTPVFGGDIPCLKFWNRHDDEGPILELRDPRLDERHTVYVESGDDPTELVEEMNDILDE